MRPEAVDGVVGDGDGLLHRVVGDDAKHRAEDLLLGDAHARAHLGKDRRLDVEPDIQTARTALSAGDELRAFRNADADHGLDPVELGTVGDRTMGGGLRERIADDDLICGPLGDRLDLGKLRARHDHARRRAARLAEVAEAGGDAQRNGAIEIGVRQDHVRRLAAELLRDALDRRRGGLGHRDAGAGGAGDRDHVDIRMGRETRPDAWAVTIDEVEDHRPGSRLPRSPRRTGRALKGESSLGFSTTVQPAASAGATLAVIW